jgi:hypothetical protein
MQGITVFTALVNVGSKLFAPGQAYDAASRVKQVEVVWMSWIVKNSQMKTLPTPTH